MKDGIYYITMGGTLDYSCRNNNQRPRCESDYAFAVLKVGNPDPEKKITLENVKRNDAEHLKTSLVKSGPFGSLNNIEWFFEGEKLSYDNEKEIPLSEYGIYKVVWSNCFTSVSESINYTTNGTELISKPGLVDDSISVDESKDAVTDDDTELAVLIENNDKFVLKNLIFDLDKATIKPEAQKMLNQLAQIMKDHPTMKILLEGHTAIGNARQNKVLSERRVASTKKYLVAQGVAKNHIETKGWGQKKPLVVTKNITEGRINRRVEIQILSR